jgi:ATP-dependent DNA helicase RecG
MSMSREVLQKLLNDLESDHVERTVATKNIDKFCKAVCAFANDFPNHKQAGYLLVGVDDSGHPCGLTVTDHLLQNLVSTFRSDGNIQPLPAVTVEKITMSEGDVAVVSVMPSDLPPVRYKGQIWIRTGPRSTIANEQEERILSERRLSNTHTFDVTPIPEASIDDLSLELFNAYRPRVVAQDVIAANHRSIEEQLAALRFYDFKKSSVNVASILLFGKNPRYFLPGAYIQYLKLPGKTLTDMPVDQAEISGDLLSVLRELDVRLKSTIQHSLLKESILAEKNVSDYPEIALRELLMNAIIHRDYQSNTPIRFYWFSDRIEIQSPGGLYGEVTPATLTTRNSYRNPIIAEAMKALGYVNRYGYGIQRAEEALKENDSPPLQFEIGNDNKTFLVIIHRRAS